MGLNPLSLSLFRRIDFFYFFFLSPPSFSLHCTRGCVLHTHTHTIWLSHTQTRRSLLSDYHSPSPLLRLWCSIVYCFIFLAFYCLIMGRINSPAHCLRLFFIHVYLATNVEFHSSSWGLNFTPRYIHICIHANSFSYVFFFFFLQIYMYKFFCFFFYSFSWAYPESTDCSNAVRLVAPPPFVGRNAIFTLWNAQKMRH